MKNHIPLKRFSHYVEDSLGMKVLKCSDSNRNVDNQKLFVALRKR